MWKERLQENTFNERCSLKHRLFYDDNKSFWKISDAEDDSVQLIAVFFM